jgi:cytochrome c-type biogenesis protein CcmH/NrfG
MDAEILQALLDIRRMMIVVTFLSLLIALAMIASMIFNWRQNMENTRAGDFFTQGNAMLNRGDLERLLVHCDKHLADLPADAGAHWLKANALYRRKDWHNALISYRKAEELQPGWGLGPAISELEEKLAQAPRSPDLKVVSPNSAVKDDGQQPGKDDA